MFAHDRKGKKESCRPRSCLWPYSGWVLWSYRIRWDANWQMAFRFISNWCDNHSATGIDSHGYLILEIEAADRSILERFPCINTMVEGAGAYFRQNRIAQVLNNRAEPAWGNQVVRAAGGQVMVRRSNGMFIISEAKRYVMINATSGPTVIVNRKPPSADSSLNLYRIYASTKGCRT